MKLFIPPLGTKIILTQDWSFDLFHEYRNDSLLKAQGFVDENISKYSWEKHGVHVKTSLPAGTSLTIDRIYIRHGSKDFDSVSFWIGSKPKGVGYKGKVRFWAKLKDVNDIEYEIEKQE